MECENNLVIEVKWGQNISKYIPKVSQGSAYI